MEKRDTKEVIFVIVTVMVAIVIGAGCTYTKVLPPMKPEWDVPLPPSVKVYKYYVIDAHSDIPDAHFTTYDEAATYQKEFAEHHEYVIVKMEGKYNVYNMEPIENDTQTVQKSE